MVQRRLKQGGNKSDLDIQYIASDFHNATFPKIL